MRIHRLPLPFEAYQVDILGACDLELVEISRALRLGLSLEEMRSVKRYFASRGRNPTDLELRSIGAMWSEHCRHKTFRGLVISSDGEVVEDMLETYIAGATRGVGAGWVVSFLKDNAGLVDFVDGYAIAVKVETHNHPSAVDPFGGAATGVGGVIRDVLAVWAKPIALIDALCFGPLDYPQEKIPGGVRHPRLIYKGVVAGIGFYGNNVGIPTVAGSIYFDEGYVGNPVVYAGCVGILPRRLYRWDARPGDLAAVLGNSTGRDGIHGATFASSELEGSGDRSAVQIPDPVEGEKIRRAVLRIRDEGLGSGITDLGGGGLAVALSEMAHRIGGGARVELERLHLREPLEPWEIWISESQERMLLAVPPESVGRVVEIAEEEDLRISVIGEFTKEKRIVASYRGHVLADLDVEFLATPPRVVRIASWTPPSHGEPSFPEPEDLGEEILALLASPNISSREEVIRTYDHEVQGITALKPLVGDLGGPSDAVILKPLEDRWEGIVISLGMKPSYSRIDPYWMAASSIEEALRNNVAVGGRRISILDNFTWGNPEKPDRMGGLLRAVKACHDFAKAFGTPFVSGKDSLYNESPAGPVLGTLLVTAIGVIPDVRRAVTLSLKREGDLLYILGITRRELGGSEYYRLKGYIGSSVPRVYPGESRRCMESLVEAIDRGLVEASHDLSEGGLGVAAAEMIISGGLGAEIFLDRVPREGVERNDHLLFSESNGRFLVEVRRDLAGEFEDLVRRRGCTSSAIGLVRSGGLRIYAGGERILADLGIGEMARSWKSGLRL